MLAEEEIQTKEAHGLEVWRKLGEGGLVGHVALDGVGGRGHVPTCWRSQQPWEFSILLHVVERCGNEAGVVEE